MACSMAARDRLSPSRWESLPSAGSGQVTGSVGQLPSSSAGAAFSSQSVNSAAVILDSFNCCVVTLGGYTIEYYI